MAAPNCPTCAGRHLDGWRWDHTNTCALRVADDQRQDADATTVRARGPFTRPSTATEVQLHTAAYGTAPDPSETTVHGAGGYWSRAVGGRSSADPAV